ncbi:MAG TPA: hypothetical protein GX506_01580 [Firmicutes bacterium]|nr:hypothetical protein [Bacillota bacterium]
MSLQDLANASIGQGVVEVTPLQVAKLISAVANGGVVPAPRIVKEIRDPAGGTARRVDVIPGKRVFEPHVTALMREMLRDVVRHGTGRQAEVPRWGAAGKTGTSETGRLTADGRSITHGWFAGYVPYDDPRLVIVVFDEEGGAGGEDAARAFGEIAERTCTFLSHAHILNNES